MKTINTNSWEEFEECLKELERERIQKKCASKFLYRGQGDSTLTLLTTLERSGKERISLKEYHHLIVLVKPQIESFTGSDYNILSYPKGIEGWLQKNDTLIPHAFGCSEEFASTYSYMTYLRHYGFPSPFIDWSNSVYVATFFSFRKPSPSKNDVSVYVYLESESEISLKTGSSNKPYIWTFGPYIRSDRRHFIQQSRYTVCIIRNGEWAYESHEKVFEVADSDQDILWKFNVPYSERVKVLKVLDGYNINSLSLFGEKESLMETMALREIDFREKEL